LGVVPGVLDRDLVVVTGKGGVGKSTVAAALGLLAARRGARAIVAEVSGREDARRLLEGSGVDHLTVTPRAAMEEYLNDQLPSRTLADVLASSGMFASFVTATPGMDELLTVGKVWELAQDQRRTPGARPYDVVILDAPASGHGLAMLAAPRTFSEAARVGPIHRQAGRIDATLSDPERTAVVAVAIPEEMPVNETLEIRRGLREQLGRDLDAVVANGVVPDRFTREEAAALDEAAGAGGPGASAVRAALWAHARAHEQRGQLRRLRAGLDAPPVRLPYLFAAALGRAEAERLADALEVLA
jgi:anion-transporting  ArsA/GET3 family ATPase